MFARSGGILRKALVPVYGQPKRQWAQVGLVVSTPPRVPCSFGEKLIHMACMLTVWVTPMAYFMTQIKVWRREYIET